MDKNKLKILEILSVIFDEYEITEDLTKDDIEQWDSLASAQIIMELEREFGKYLTYDEISSMNSVGDIIRIVIGGGI